MFLILPTLIDVGLSLFQCIEIDTGDFRVSADLDIIWYSPQHIFWWFMLSLPILVVWVFGTQFLILVYLFKNRKKLNSVSVKQYFHVIYIGYREEWFYWEFVNILKKFILIALNVFLSQVPKAYKGMIAITTIIMLIRLQRFLKPYKLKVNNEVENSSMVAIGFTLYGGLLFIKGQSKVSFIDALVFMLVIAVNSVYIMFWVYLMAKTYDRFEIAKKLSILLKIVLFRGENDTVLSATSDVPKSDILTHKNKGKGLRFNKNQINKLDPYEWERSSRMFMINS